MASVSVQLGLLAVAKDPANPDLSGVTAATERITGAGHKVVALHTAADVEDEIRDQLTHWINDPEIDVVLVLGGAETSAASAALKPLITEVIPGFTDLFRWMMFQERGASAMLASAEAARCDSTFIFVLPGAVGAAMEKLILPQFDPTTTPRNLLGDMPRLRDAVPTEVVVEKTQGGSGLQHRLPARPKSRTGANVISRHAVDDPPTKPIDLERLQREIAKASGKSEDITKPHEIAALLPRLPPGADDDGADTIDPDDDFTATDLLAAPELPAEGKRPSRPGAIGTQSSPRGTGAGAPHSGGIPSITKRGTPSTAPIASGAVGSGAANAPSRTGAPSGSGAAATRSPGATPPASGPARTASPSVGPRPAADARPRTGTEPRTAATDAGSVPASPGRPTGAARGPATPSTGPRNQPTEQLPFVPRPPADRAPVAPRIPEPPAERAGTPSTPPRTTKAPSTPPRNQPTEQLPFVPRPPADRAPVAERITEDASAKPTSGARNQPTEQYPTVGRKPAVPTGSADVARTPPTPTTDALLAERDAAIERAARAAAKEEAPTTLDDAASATIDAHAHVILPRPEDAAPATTSGSDASASTAAPRTRPPTPPPPAPVRTRPITQPPPAPVRARPATLPPPAAARGTDADRPKNLFAEPRKKKTSTLVLQIFACVAVVVLGFGAVVYVFGNKDKPADTTVAATPPPPVVVDAAAVAPPPPVDAEAEPDIEMEPTPPVTPTPTPTPTPPPTPRTPTPRPPATPRTPTPRTPTAPTTAETPVVPTPTPPAPVDAAVAPVADDDCDETACVLSKYDRPCCAKYKPTTSDFQPRVGGLPESLDKPMVRAGVATIKARVVTCGEKNPGAGTVKIAVTVSAEGAVTDASVVDAPSPALGDCVAGAMRAAKFGKTVGGGTFTYPFLFGGS